MIEALGAVAPGDATVRLGIRTAVLPCVLCGVEREASFVLMIPQREIGPGVWEREEETRAQPVYATA